MFKVFLALLFSVFATVAVMPPKSVPIKSAQTKASIPILILKPDTVIYSSASHDTVKMIKIDSIWITKHYKDSLFFTGADTVVRSSKPVFIKK